MANNLHISYDLYAPGQNYEKVIAEIQKLGNWAKIHKSYWYVDSSLTSQQAVKRLWAVMDKNDSLYVVDATNKDASWENILPEVAEHIQKHWNL